MSTGNGDGGPGTGATVAVVRPLILVRYRPGVVGETARVVHVVELSTDGPAGAVSTVCGAVLLIGDLETVTRAEGMPCTACVVHHMISQLPTGSTDTAGSRPAADGVAYQEWGWPVTCHRDQLRLGLHRDVSALAIPIALCTEVTQILTQRRCFPPVLAHPYAPEHHILLTEERYGVPLPWPPQVHQITGTLLLPPTTTPRGPITWIHPPQQSSLRICREIDLIAALTSCPTMIGSR